LCEKEGTRDNNLFVASRFGFRDELLVLVVLYVAKPPIPPSTNKIHNEAHSHDTHGQEDKQHHSNHADSDYDLGYRVVVVLCHTLSREERARSADVRSVVDVDLPYPEICVTSKVHFIKKVQLQSVCGKYQIAEIIHGKCIGPLESSTVLDEDRG